jgi:hypothetical protein
MNPIPTGFLIIWVFFGIVTLLFFWLNKNAKQKRKYFPWWIGFIGVLFGTFVYLMGAPAKIFIIFIPAICLISFMNIKMTKFCDKCGRTIINQMFFSGNFKHCPYCTAKLK